MKTSHIFLAITATLPLSLFPINDPNLENLTTALKKLSATIFPDSGSKEEQLTFLKEMLSDDLTAVNKTVYRRNYHDEVKGETIGEIFIEITDHGITYETQGASAQLQEFLKKYESYFNDYDKLIAKAADRNNIGAVKILVEQVGKKPALLKQIHNAVTALINKGSSKQEEEFGDEAEKLINFFIAQKIKEPKAPWTWLHEAARHGNFGIAKALVENKDKLGIDINAHDEKGCTPLFHAGNHRMNKVATFLHNNGAVEENSCKENPLEY